MTKKIKVLNLYAGIGGNRKLWPDNIEVTAVELDENIANAYKQFFPNDKVIVADAHKYLLDHYGEFDFIWSSPPCPTHSRMRKCFTFANDEVRRRDLEYPDMRLYQEILLLKHFFKGKWVVENVNPYYEPLIKPFFVGRHYYWANFNIPGKKAKFEDIEKGSIENKEKIKGFDLSVLDKVGFRKDQVLNNCVDSKVGLFVFECSQKQKQSSLNNYNELMENLRGQNDE